MAHLLLWLSHDPYTTSHASEAVRLGTMASAFDLDVQLLFIADGVRALVPNQEPYRLGPPAERLFGPLLTPERPGLVDLASLGTRRIDPAELPRTLPLRPLASAEVAEAVRSADWVEPL